MQLQAHSILKTYDRLRAERSSFNNIYQDVTDYVMPNRADFTTTVTPGDSSRYRKIYKNVAKYAELLTSSILGATSASTLRWFELTSSNEVLQEDKESKDWLEACTDIMFDVLNSPYSNFGSQNHEVLLDWVTYGTGCMFISDDNGHPRFRSYPISDVFIEESYMGIVDTVFRSFKLTGRQAMQQFPDADPEFTDRCKNRQDDKFTFIHYVTKNDYDNTFPIKSCYINIDTKKIVDEGGFNEMPYMVPRWYKVSGEMYGRGPAISAMPDIKMLNAMVETTIRLAQKIADPITLVADDDTIRPLRMRPGGFIYGAIDSNGRPKIAPYPVNGNVPYTEQAIQQVVQDIKEAFFVDHLLVIDAPSMTATEVVTRQEERMRLLSPQLVRLQTEYFSIMIDRLFSILLRAGKFPLIPQAVAAVTAESGEQSIDIQYSGALARSQKSQQAQTLNRLFESLMPIMQLDPSSADYINADETLKEHAELIGFKQKLLRTDDEVMALRKGRAQQQQQQQLAGLVENVLPKAIK